jgi:hypothetical protein
LSGNGGVFGFSFDGTLFPICDSTRCGEENLIDDFASERRFCCVGDRVMSGLLWTRLFSRLKGAFRRNWRFLISTVLSSVLIAFLPSLGPYVYNKIVEKDVVVYFIDGGDLDELLNVVNASWRKEILGNVSNEKKLEEFIKKHEQESKSKASATLSTGLLRELFDFYFPSDYGRGIWHEVTILEIRNNRSQEIKKVQVKVPDVFSLSGIRVLAPDLHPNKISEMEKSFSLNKDTRTLFLNEIGEFPANSVVRIYLIGSTSTFPFKGPTITFEGGAAKIVHLKRLDPQMEEQLKRLYPVWPSWQVFLLSAICVMMGYLVYKIRKKDNPAESSPKTPNAKGVNDDTDLPKSDP